MLIDDFRAFRQHLATYKKHLQWLFLALQICLMLVFVVVTRNNMMFLFEKLGDDALTNNFQKESFPSVELAEHLGELYRNAYNQTVIPVLGAPRLWVVRDPRICDCLGLGNDYPMHFKCDQTQTAHPCAPSNDQNGMWHYGRVPAVSPVQTRYRFYESDGFFTDLPHPQDGKGEEIIHDLVKLKWLDEGSRLVVLEIPVVDTDTLLIAQVQLVLEWSPFRSWSLTSRFFSERIWRSFVRGIPQCQQDSYPILQKALAKKYSWEGRVAWAVTVVLLLQVVLLFWETDWPHLLENIYSKEYFELTLPFSMPIIHGVISLAMIITLVTQMVISDTEALTLMCAPKLDAAGKMSFVPLASTRLALLRVMQTKSLVVAWLLLKFPFSHHPLQAIRRAFFGMRSQCLIFVRVTLYFFGIALMFAICTRVEIAEAQPELFGTVSKAFSSMFQAFSGEKKVWAALSDTSVTGGIILKFVIMVLVAYTYLGYITELLLDDKQPEMIRFSTGNRKFGDQIDDEEDKLVYNNAVGTIIVENLHPSCNREQCNG